MNSLQRYRRKQRTTVTAVRVDLDIAGFDYEKWGGTQRCKRGDWLVNNAGDTYTVDADVFARTYRERSPGVFEKVGDVWARRADAAGVVPTKEGSTAYEAGDWLVYNGPEARDGYAMPSETFASLYEPAER